MGFGGIFCSQGIAFLPSFGIGVAIFTPIITAIPFVTSPQWPNFAVQATILPGIASGVVWNIGTTPQPYPLQIHCKRTLDRIFPNSLVEFE
jgi:hypothetical protein